MTDRRACTLGALAATLVATFSYAVADTASLSLPTHLCSAALTGALLTWMFRNT